MRLTLACDGPPVVTTRPHESSQTLFFLLLFALLLHFDSFLNENLNKQRILLLKCLGVELKYMSLYLPVNLIFNYNPLNRIESSNLKSTA